MSSKSGFGRLFVYLAVMAALAVAAIPHGASAAPADQARSRTFPETNQTVSGRFLEVWEAQKDYNTSLYINGFPVTDKHAEVNFDDGKTYQTQWFERARFEEHPENQKPYDVLLGRLGAYAAEGRTDAPFKKIAKPASGTWFQETGHTISGAIEKYWNQYGGLSQFGFPLSEQFTEVSKDDPSKSYTVQYFERQRFELHPENAGTQFEVLLGRLGAEQMGQVEDGRMTYKDETGTPVDAIRIGMSQEPDSLFSATSTLYVTGVVLGPVENGLVARDDKGVYHGDLAYFFPTVDNGGAFYTGQGKDKRLVVKYKLKRGVKWSDGAAFDSNDVIFGFRVVMDPDVQVGSRSVQQKIQNIDNPDAYTVIVNYMTSNEAAAALKKDPEGLVGLKPFVDAGTPVVDSAYNKNPTGPVYPQHILKQFEGHFGDIVSSDFARKPVGTGPYMVKDWTPGVSITLEANPNYNVQPEKPRIKTLLFKIIADTNQLLAQLKTGDVQVATSDGLSLNQAPELDKLGDSGSKAYYTPAATWEHVDFNLDRAVFQDVRVRQAIAYGLNRKDIVDKVLFGKSIQMDSWIPPLSSFSVMNDNMKSYLTKFPITKYDYNPDKAKQLLDQAGWTVGGDGIRAKGGQRLAFKWTTTAANKQREAVTQIAQQNLKAIGMDVTLEYVPAQQFFADDGTVYHRLGDAMEFAWVSDIDPGGDELFDSTQIPSEDNNFSGQNIPGWKNARNDTLIRAATNSISVKEREAAYAEQQSIWSQEVPQVALFVRPNIAAAVTGLSNFRPANTNTPETWNAQEWFLKK
jgi:peptide/nickel transport system substrate-binding protein